MAADEEIQPMLDGKQTAEQAAANAQASGSKCSKGVDSSRNLRATQYAVLRSLPPRKMREYMNSHGAKRAIVPYLYQAPTIVLLAMLMLIPIITVVRYSLLDNVIMSRHPRSSAFRITHRPFRPYVRDLAGQYAVFHRGERDLPPAGGAGLRVDVELAGGHPRDQGHPQGLLHHAMGVHRHHHCHHLAAAAGPQRGGQLCPAGHRHPHAEMPWFSTSNVALHALTFVNIWAGYPFYMVSLLAGLQGIPTELYEASTIDGANEGQKFWHITIPQLMPIITSIAMLDFIWTMQVFPLVWMTTGGGPLHATEVLGTYTYKIAFATLKFSLASASAVIVLVFSVCVAFFYVRQQRARD